MMDNRLKILLSLPFFLLAAVSAFVFRAVPAGRVWEGFRVMYVESSFPQESVIGVLEANGISDSVNRLSSADSFFDAYFSDADGKFNLFYVPDGHASALEKSVADIKDAGASDVGLDGGGGYDVSVPVFCLLFFFVLFVFSPSRVELSFEGLLAVASVFSRPFPALAVAACLSLFALTLLLRYRRKYFVRSRSSDFSLLSALKASVPKGELSLLSIVLLMFAPVLVLVFCDFACALLLFLSLVAALCLFSFCEFSRITSAGIFSVGAFKKFCVCVLIVVSFFLGAFVRGERAEGGSAAVASDSCPSLPAPVPSAESSLPAVEDFVLAEWRRLTYPYRPLGDETEPPVQEGDFVSVTEYSEKNGVIVPEERKVFVFNNDFRKMVYDSISASSNSICGVLLSQTSDFFGYSGTVAYGSPSVFGKGDAAVLVSCLSLLMLFAGCHIFWSLRRSRAG